MFKIYLNTKKFIIKNKKYKINNNKYLKIIIKI